MLSRVKPISSTCLSTSLLPPEAFPPAPVVELTVEAGGAAVDEPVDVPVEPEAGEPEESWAGEEVTAGLLPGEVVGVTVSAEEELVGAGAGAGAGDEQPAAGVVPLGSE